MRALGRSTKAFESLRKALEDRSLASIKVNPIYDPFARPRVPVSTAPREPSALAGAEKPVSVAPQHKARRTAFSRLRGDPATDINFKESFMECRG
jgi:hypothetical protein